MATRISATQLGRALSDILNRVHYRGEEFLIERNGEMVATLQPASMSTRATWRTLSEALAGFPLGDVSFADDLEAIQAHQPAFPG